MILLIRNSHFDLYYLYSDTIYYLLSLVIDFKYRTKGAIWYGKCNCQKQLNSYNNETRSRFISYKNENASKRIRPVAEVWALYPDMQNLTDVQNEDDANIRLFPFVPGYQDYISGHLENFINDYVGDLFDDVNHHNGMKAEWK